VIRSIKINRRTINVTLKHNERYVRLILLKNDLEYIFFSLPSSDQKLDFRRCLLLEEKYK
jgi:hypothetical protein